MLFYFGSDGGPGNHFWAHIWALMGHMRSNSEHLWLHMGATLSHISDKRGRCSNVALIFAYRCVFGFICGPNFEHLWGMCGPVLNTCGFKWEQLWVESSKVNLLRVDLDFISRPFGTAPLTDKRILHRPNKNPSSLRLPFTRVINPWAHLKTEPPPDPQKNLSPGIESNMLYLIKLNIWLDMSSY